MISRAPNRVATGATRPTVPAKATPGVLPERVHVPSNHRMQPTRRVLGGGARLIRRR